MAIVTPKYRALLDDTTSVKDPLALLLMQRVEPEISVTWNLIPSRAPIEQLEYKVASRDITAREVVTSGSTSTGATTITFDATTKVRVTAGQALFYPTTGEVFVLGSATANPGEFNIRKRNIFADPAGAQATIASGSTLLVMAQSEFYEEINATSRFEGTSDSTNYIQDVTERLDFSVADLREARKWGIGKQTMLDERLRDVMKDLNRSLIYNVPVAPTSSVTALTQGFDHAVLQAGSTVDAALSGTADLADLRGVLKQLRKNGVGPGDGLAIVSSINVFHAYEDEGLNLINLQGQPGAEFVIGGQVRAVSFSGLGDVPFYADPFIDDDKVRFICTSRAGKAIYQGENGPQESLRVVDEPSLSTSKVNVSTMQLKWGTIFENADKAHYILSNTGLN